MAYTQTKRKTSQHGDRTSIRFSLNSPISQGTVMRHEPCILQGPNYPADCASSKALPKILCGLATMMTEALPKKTLVNFPNTPANER